MFQKTGANLLHISAADHRSVYLLDACTQNGVQNFNPPVAYDSIQRPYLDLFKNENISALTGANAWVGANADTALHYMISRPDAHIIMLTDEETAKSILRLLLNQTENMDRDYIIVLPTMGAENCTAAARLIQEAVCGRKILRRIMNYAQNHCADSMKDKLKIRAEDFVGLTQDILSKQNYRDILTDPAHTGATPAINADKQNILGILLRANIPLDTAMRITVRTDRHKSHTMTGTALEAWESGLKFKPSDAQPEQLLAYSDIQDFEILDNSENADKTETAANFRAILLRKEHCVPLTSDEIIRMAELLALGHDSVFEQVTIEGMYDTALGFIKITNKDALDDFNIDDYTKQVKRILNDEFSANGKYDILGVDTLLTEKLP